MHEKTGHIAALDGLRAVAVGLVFLTHAYPRYFPGGFIGVDIFFVLSGYVITRGMSDGVNLRRFYIRRFLRIVPPILPVLAAVSLSVALGSTFTRPLDVFAAGASFMNILRAFDVSHGGVLGHFWSLSIEEQFYLLWPAMFLLVRGRAPIIAAVTLCLFAWQSALFLSSRDVERVYNGLDTRAGQLLAGCVLALWNPRSSPWLALIPLAALIPFVLLVGFESPVYLTLGIPLAASGSALVIGVLAGPTTALHRILETAPFQWGGIRSYALYLWHYPFLMWGFQALPAGVPSVVAVVGALLATMAAAELSQRVLEAPARRYARRHHVVETSAPQFAG